MADLGHLEFYGFNNGFFEKPNYNLLLLMVFQKIAFFCILASTSMYDFLLVVNRHHSSKLFSF